MNNVRISMLTYRDGLLGGSVVLQGQVVSVKPFNVHSESTPKEREALLVGAAVVASTTALSAELQLQEDTDYEYKQ